MINKHLNIWTVCRPTRFCFAALNHTSKQHLVLVNFESNWFQMYIFLWRFLKILWKVQFCSRYCTILFPGFASRNHPNKSFEIPTSSPILPTKLPSRRWTTFSRLQRFLSSIWPSATGGCWGGWGSRAIAPLCTGFFRKFCPKAPTKS